MRGCDPTLDSPHRTQQVTPENKFHIALKGATCTVDSAKEVKKFLRPHMNIKKLEDGVATRVPGSLQGIDMRIADCKNSSIYILDRTAQVQIDRCVGLSAEWEVRRRLRNWTEPLSRVSCTGKLLSLRELQPGDCRRPREGVELTPFPPTSTLGARTVTFSSGRAWRRSSSATARAATSSLPCSSFGRGT